MNEAETLVKKITEGIQEKKGKNIVIADLTAINDTICSYFVICQGNSPSHRPKKPLPDPEFESKRYYQVYGQKHGFQMHHAPSIVQVDICHI